MYNLSQVDAYQNPGQDPAYMLEIVPVAQGLAAISSDQKLSLFDPLNLSKGPVRTIRTTHGNINCARAYDASNSIVCTAGENGTVSLWDLRLDGSKAQIATPGGSDAPLVSLACSAAGNAIVAGTEFTNHQASILIWDARAGSAPSIRYTEVHSDDVTELNFHPTSSNILLSGSTDGLVNICDTTITDEDEVVIQTFNHGSIHHAGFLNNTEVYAASHDEKFALYDMAENQEVGSATVDFGDIREVLNCQYVANVTPKMGDNGAVIGAGSQNQQLFQLIHMAKSPTWSFSAETSVGLPGAHGSELVRSFRFFDQEQVVFTAGEDGKIIAWRPS
ncbi:WD40-repeat-containing domain protein [Coniella lustricola]|uniref:WD40-repeat-containing domain protein n=1 Tax=Coniella lustricola TaxID=2025994 RepID=A0A2T3AA01_9PEZI|nr:WD40-repeat-containing domain protein [Coniella lustricola]